jgi:hypothetical protein
MPQEDLAQKLQQIQHQVVEHAQGTTEIADMERLLLSELLNLGQALLQEFIDQKKVHSAAGPSPGASPAADAR